MFFVLRRGALLSQIASGGTDEAITPYSFRFIFHVYPPIIKIIMVTAVDTSLWMLEMKRWLERKSHLLPAKVIYALSVYCYVFDILLDKEF